VSVACILPACAARAVFSTLLLCHYSPGGRVSDAFEVATFFAAHCPLPVFGCMQAFSSLISLEVNATFHFYAPTRIRLIPS
jgi:hypothetical protein